MLIRGGRIVDPAQGLEALFDLRIRAGVIAEIGEHLHPEGDEPVLDASGAYVAPGFIDMHVHLREPGFPEKETFATGTAAAVAGGFTAVAAMPNTNPSMDTVEVVRGCSFPILRQAQDDKRTAQDDKRTAQDDTGVAHHDSVKCRVYPIAAITRGRRGSELVDYAALSEAGAVAFSDDGNTVMNSRVLRDAALAALDVAGCFIGHCEDEHIKGDAVMNEGATSRRLGLRGSPPVAEDVIVARDLLIARDTGKAWHIAHITTKGAMDLVNAARASGPAVTCEVTPHHLVFTDELIGTHGSGAKVNPPLRTQADVNALRAAVMRNEIDAFATDHAPHTQREKSEDVSCGAVGFTGLEIAVGAYAYALPQLTLRRFVEMLSVNPARILGVPGGTLKIGSPADITIFADREWQVDAQQFYSKGKSTPFDGMTLPRRAVATIVGGRVMYDALASTSSAVLRQAQHDKSIPHDDRER